MRSLEVARHLEGTPQGAAVHTEARGRRHRPVHRQRLRQLRQLARGKSVVSMRSNQSTDPQLHSRPERRRSRRCSGISTPEIRQTGILQSVRVPPLVRRRRRRGSPTLVTAFVVLSYDCRRQMCPSPHARTVCRNHKSTEDAGTDCMTWEFLIVDAALLIESRATKPKKQEAVIKNPGDTALPVSRISHVDT